MSPELIAAIIAASVSLLTLIVSVGAQVYGIHRTSNDTEKARTEQREQLDKTLAEQREQLDKTLAEQREQLDRTLTEQRARTLNERFATAADKLGGDKPPAVRLAGVYAMAGLADDWQENRQTCVDVLCAYLRLPYACRPDDDAPPEEMLDFRASREVRRAVIHVITAHLKGDAAAKSWQGLNFNFIGVVFDAGNFADAKFSGGTVDFGWAEFSGERVDFNRVEFSGGKVNFGGAGFASGTVHFSDAKFLGAAVSFRGARFISGTADFRGVSFASGTVDFTGAQFLGATLDFSAVAAWSQPPTFGSDGPPPDWVKLPPLAGQEPR
jgi:Pentapeptide repeats (9 copies)